MLTEQQLTAIETEMVEHYGRNTPEAQDFAFRALARLLADARELRQLRAQLGPNLRGIGNAA